MPASPRAVRAPSVSVVMPTLNRRALLPEVLAPLLADGGADKIVVVVDGCDDGSYELLLGLAHRDPRLRPLLIENRGENGARGRHRGGRGRGRAPARRRRAGASGAGRPPRPPARGGLGTRRAGLHAAGRRPELRHATLRARIRRRLRSLRAQAARHPAQPLGGQHVAAPGGLRARPCGRQRAGARLPRRPCARRCLDAGLRGVFDRSLLADHLHDRSLDGFVHDARNQGAADVMLHRLHGDRLGPHPGPEQFGRGLPLPLRRWLALCRRPRAAAASSRALGGATCAAGRLRAHRLEELCGRVLRRIEQQRGALGAR